MIIIIAKKTEPKIKDELEVLTEIKNRLKNEPLVHKIFKDHQKDLNLLDGIPIDISDDLDVSAKTVNSRIILNRALLYEPFDVLMRYVIHELTHALQHIDAESTGDIYNNYEYLDRPDELEAFKNQIEFDKDKRGPKAVEKYVDDLLNYHEIPEEDKPEKKEELLEN